MDHYAAVLPRWSNILNLKNAVHIGHSTGGGEATHYVARHGRSGPRRELVLIAPCRHHGEDAANPGGQPIEVFEVSARHSPTTVRNSISISLRTILSFNRPGAKPITGRHPELVAPEHDGERQRRTTTDQRVLETDLTKDLNHRRPDARHARDDDRSFRLPIPRRCREASQERQRSRSMKKFPHGMVHHACRCCEPGPARLHRRVAHTARRRPTADAPIARDPRFQPKRSSPMIARLLSAALAFFRLQHPADRISVRLRVIDESEKATCADLAWGSGCTSCG